MYNDIVGEKQLTEHSKTAQDIRVISPLKAFHFGESELGDEYYLLSLKNKQKVPIVSFPLRFITSLLFPKLIPKLPKSNKN